MSACRAFKFFRTFFLWKKDQVWKYFPSITLNLYEKFLVTGIVHTFFLPVYYVWSMKYNFWHTISLLWLTVCGKFDTFSHHNLSDTQWPWHAAIYIRSPPNHTASTHRSRGMTVSDQQEASEESTFWYLACSGALLTQRSVLVAAQCVVDKDKQQPLHSAHVKVVIGMQHRTSKDPLKSHHLRVQHSWHLLLRENLLDVLYFCF